MDCVSGGGEVLTITDVTNIVWRGGSDFSNNRLSGSVTGFCFVLFSF